MVDAGKFPRARFPVPSHSMERLVANMYENIILLLHILLCCLKHGTFLPFLLCDKRKLKRYFMFSGGED
jgi:hypothetical protein